MANVTPLPREALPEFEEMFAAVEQGMGFVPNSLFTMGHRPEILRAFTGLSMAVMGKGTVPRELKQLLALVASTAAGCRYCQAHTSSSAARVARSADRVEAVHDFETSDLFNEAERAALRLARDAGIQPNAVTAAHFEALRQRYSDEQVVEMMAMIALFGFLNRWNDSMATDLEDEPVEFASQHLGAIHWEAGKHRD